ncbi:MAG: T9SS C-terminal target domain-containing protein [Flavobacteriales bacterium]|nr:T9SS C-terminal target domain-containing protein [Flavobacteriales bacterium]
MILWKNTTLGLLVLGTLAVALPACKKKEGCTDPAATNYDPDADKDCCCEYATVKEFTVTDLGGGVSQISGETDVDFTFTSDRKWLLNGFVYVNSGATLTVQPGTIVKGDKDSKGTLIIRRGGKLMADGTSSQPIVFTSNQPVGSRSYGDWGGIILCGRAPHNQPSDPVIEGGPDAQYGGSDANDNSGVLRYVRIEFCGIAFQPNQEINGLTLGAVGRGTTIDNVQVSYSGDDSYEWFGGTVNAKHLIAFRGWDDDFDQDFGWQGKVQWAVSLRDPNVADASSSNGFECDNDAAGNSASPYSQGTWSNVSIFGPMVDAGTSINSLYKRALHLRRNTQTRVFNSMFAGYPFGLYIDGNSTQANATNGDLMFRSNVLAGMTTALDVPTGQNWDQAAITTWFNTAGWGNTVLANNTDLMVADGFNLSGPNFRPSAGSPLLSGADFSWSPLTDSFFTSVNYRGAFGSEDWTAGWANWDPQNTPY